MKIYKILIIVLSMFVSINALPIFAYAETDYKTGEEKFDEYIASLPSEYANLILSDIELVKTMKQDSYWSNSEPNKITRNTYDSLPVPGYPNGSYYTHNGGPCSCHDDCDYNIGISNSRCYIENTNSLGNCKVYSGTGSMQCKGFADHIYYLYNDVNVSARYSVNVSSYTTIPHSESGINLVEEFFSSLPVGSNVRVKMRSTGGRHSIIISNKSSTGVTVYDANSDGETCIVKNRFLSWEDLAEKYSGIVSAWRGL